MEGFRSGERGLRRGLTLRCRLIPTAGGPRPTASSGLHYPVTKRGQTEVLHLYHGDCTPKSNLEFAGPLLARRWGMLSTGLLLCQRPVVCLVTRVEGRLDLHFRSKEVKSRGSTVTSARQTPGVPILERPTAAKTTVQGVRMRLDTSRFRFGAEVRCCYR